MTGWRLSSQTGSVLGALQRTRSWTGFIGPWADSIFQTIFYEDRQTQTRWEKIEFGWGWGGGVLHGERDGGSVFCLDWLQIKMRAWRYLEVEIETDPGQTPLETPWSGLKRLRDNAAKNLESAAHFPHCQLPPSEFCKFKFAGGGNGSPTCQGG